MAYDGWQVKISCFDLMKQITELKVECEWLKEINSQSLQQSIRNLDNAFVRFFNGRGSLPKFKKKTNAGSFRVPQNIKLKDDRLIISKFNKGIKIVKHIPTVGKIRSVTISKTSTGKYFASILCETGEENKAKLKIDESSTIGVDLGVKDLAVTSNGEAFKNPKNLRKAQSKLKYIQRKYSKYKGKRTKHKLAITHEKVANKRKDFLHKASTKLIRENQSIALETLNVSGMLKNHNLAQSISDAGWSTFVSMLEYKSEWYGVNLLRIGRFEPSSKVCSNCGAINKELQLKDREWSCKSCNVLHDRDINAAINIKTFAIKNHLSVGHRLKNQNELPTLVGVLTSEAQPYAFGVNV